MNVAIIGAGFSGLATAWYFLQHTPYKVTLYDSEEIGRSTSGLAAGLLHPYAGLHAKLNNRGIAGFSATSSLLIIASEALGEPVSERSGLLRLALTEQNQRDYAVCAQQFNDVQWLSREECQERVPGIAGFPGIFIESCLTVQAELYLKGLWVACEKRGAHFNLKKINHLDELTGFDLVILTMGASHPFKETTHLPISTLKGQIIELTWPTDLPPLPIPLNSQAYIVMNFNKRTCLVGATFERDYKSPLPDLSHAIEELWPKAVAMFPALERSTVVGCKAGIRASTPSHLPLISQINERCLVLTGMGSKGLLYHALYAEELVQQILE